MIKCKLQLWARSTAKTTMMILILRTFKVMGQMLRMKMSMASWRKTRTLFHKSIIKPQIWKIVHWRTWISLMRSTLLSWMRGRGSKSIGELNLLKIVIGTLMKICQVSTARSGVFKTRLRHLKMLYCRCRRKVCP